MFMTDLYFSFIELGFAGYSKCAYEPASQEVPRNCFITVLLQINMVIVAGVPSERDFFLLENRNKSYHQTY